MIKLIKIEQYIDEKELPVSKAFFSINETKWYRHDDKLQGIQNSRIIWASYEGINNEEIERLLYDLR